MAPVASHPECPRKPPYALSHHPGISHGGSRKSEPGVPVIVDDRQGQRQNRRLFKKASAVFNLNCSNSAGSS